MKKILLSVSKTTSIIAVLLAALQASATKANQDFGSLIEENAAAQRQLSRELQQHLNTQNLGKTENPNFKEVGEQVLGKDTSENVAVETVDINEATVKKSYDLEKKNFKRLSEEIKDIK